MIDTDKYEGHDNWEGTKVNMANEANKLLIADAPLLLQEVKRLREENNRYLDFILWLGLEHKGKKLALEYGDEQLAEMIE